jgi:hypothetical protein
VFTSLLLFFLFQRRRRRRRHFAPRFQIAGARSLPLEAGEVLFVSPPQLEKSTSKQEREREREGVRLAARRRRRRRFADDERRRKKGAEKKKSTLSLCRLNVERQQDLLRRGGASQKRAACCWRLFVLNRGESAEREKEKLDFDERATDARSFFFFPLTKPQPRPPPSLFSPSASNKTQMAFMAEDTTVTIVPNFSLPAATGGFIRCIAVRREKEEGELEKEFCQTFLVNFFTSFLLTSFSLFSLLSTPPSPSQNTPGLLRTLLSQPPRRRPALARLGPPRHEAVPAPPSRVAQPCGACGRRRGRARLGLEVRAIARGFFGGREAAADEVSRGV